MLIPFLLIQAAGAAPSGPPSPKRERYEHCLDLAAGNAQAGAAEAARWKAGGGGFLADQCLGMAEATGLRWLSAATAFEDAERAAAAAHDGRAATYAAQAGNAWLAAGQPDKASAALDRAIASGGLAPAQLGEARIDRARAQVAQDHPAGARTDLDAALALVPGDPMAWLLSATLARRMTDIPRAQADIAHALELAPDEANVHLEAGNIAAVARDADGARTHWNRAAALAPDSPVASAAEIALRQLGSGEKDGDAAVAPASAASMSEPKSGASQ